MLMMGCEIKSVTSNKTAHEVIKLYTILKILLQIKFLRQTLFALFSTVIKCWIARSGVTFLRLPPNLRHEGKHLAVRAWVSVEDLSPIHGNTRN